MHGWVAAEWIEPPFHFKYYGFSWVKPWPGNGMYIHCAALGVLGLLIAAGFLYRVSAALFFLGFSYTFLLDEGAYLNHIYLICLFSFLSIFVPANRAFSIDAWLNPKIRSETCSWFGRLGWRPDMVWHLPVSSPTKCRAWVPSRLGCRFECMFP